MRTLAKAAVSSLVALCIGLAFVVVSVAAIGILGTRSSTQLGNEIASDELTTSTATGQLARDVDAAYATGQRAFLASGPAERARLLGSLCTRLLPAADSQLGVLARLHAHDSPVERAGHMDRTDASASQARATWFIAGAAVLGILIVVLLLLAGIRRIRRSLEPGQDQAEFADILQIANDEEEVHLLLQRHLERTLAPTTAVVLNRNNSADCVPLTVGGEVIGSVLLNHPVPYAEAEEQRIRESVGLAAPVLANLRNLAVAEIRAATDGLTGLPNKRAVTDAMKRMFAQASTTASPLGLLLLDLDHFKQINDQLGHPVGDQVLANVGAVLRNVLRSRDFAGRNGGEEFAVLLPDTGVPAALEIAERIRAGVAEISLPGTDAQVTVSIGVVGFPEHTTTLDRLEWLATRRSTWPRGTAGTGSSWLTPPPRRPRPTAPGRR